MRPHLLLLMLLAAGDSFPQGAPKARAWTDCDSVCLSLTEAIKTRPETLEMRLEDALVIRQECAGEIVAAAMNAVGSNRALRQKILDTALKVAPSMSGEILYAARNPSRRAPAAPVNEEALLASAVTIKKAIIPEIEVRRAEVAQASSAGPEVRRAIRLIVAEEIRRAEVPRVQVSMRQRR